METTQVMSWQDQVQQALLQNDTSDLEDLISAVCANYGHWTHLKEKE